MKLIAAVAKNWAIGYENHLLISIPQDMRFFRKTTEGHVVVMGRKTLESFPGGKPLKNRINIVLTANRLYEKENAVIVHDREQLLSEAGKYPSDEIFVIGGGSVYRELLPFCDTAYITKIDQLFLADTYFPDLDKAEEWYVADEGGECRYEDIRYRFLTYKRKNG